MNVLQWKMSSPIGPLHLTASEKGLKSAFWDEQDVPYASSLTSLSPISQILSKSVKQLEQYFKGERKAFELPLDLNGTEFQMRVWQALMAIPYGTTCSYSALAQNIGHEKAVRAVGTANGRNPICIIVPCHRVIAANGTLGGYSGGLHVKSHLLKLES
jgi:methylated-DNA-[protein]-cysteine S-methyltransferase